MEVTRAWWAGTLLAVAVLLVSDLILAGRQNRRPTAREAALGVAFYSGAAAVFGVLLTLGFGGRFGGEFAAGWLTEYSLSIDNLFVFMVLMSRFAVPASLQLRVLTIGIVLALVLRGLLIAAGSAAIAAFSWVFYIFGAFLLWTAWKLLHEAPDADEAEESTRLAGFLQRHLRTSRTWRGSRLTVRENGRRVLTPMLVVMIAIGVTDVLFALDSIPAIFGLTREPFLVVSANAFALMGLRQLYFLVEGLLDRLVHLAHGLSIVLAFIAVKLVLEALHDNDLPFVNGGRPVGWAPTVPVWLSLLVVIATLAVTAATSLISERRAIRSAPPRQDALSGGSSAEPGRPGPVPRPEPDPRAEAGPDPRAGQPAEPGGRRPRGGDLDRRHPQNGDPGAGPVDNRHPERAREPSRTPTPLPATRWPLRFHPPSEGPSPHPGAGPGKR